MKSWCLAGNVKPLGKITHKPLVFSQSLNLSPSISTGLLGIEKGNKFNWTITDDGLNVKVVKA